VYGAYVMYRLAIVNLGIYGAFSNAEEFLSRYFKVVRVSVDPKAAPDALARELGDVDVIIASSNPQYSREFFRLSKNVLAVIRWGVGYDNIDVSGATEEGVIACVIPNYIVRESVAEFTVALILASLRRVTLAHNFVKSNLRFSRPTYLIGDDLRDKVVGVIGLGNIGSRVVELLKAFNVKQILVYDPYVNPDVVRAYGAYPTHIDDLIVKADIITIHAPLTKETYHLINKDRFSRMKRGVYIINTSRGGLIDTEALIWALREGIVKFAALDVIEGEPEPPHLSELLKFDNVIVTPHIASGSVECYRLMDEAVALDAIRIISGEKPVGILNPEVLKSPNLRLRSRGISLKY